MFVKLIRNRGYDHFNVVGYLEEDVGFGCEYPELARANNKDSAIYKTSEGLIEILSYDGKYFSISTEQLVFLNTGRLLSHCGAQLSLGFWQQPKRIKADDLFEARVMMAEKTALRQPVSFPSGYEHLFISTGGTIYGVMFGFDSTDGEMYWREIEEPLIDYFNV